MISCRKMQLYDCLTTTSHKDEIMQRSMSPIQLLQEMAKNQTGKSDTECKFYESDSDVLDPKELSSDKKIEWFSTTCCLKDKTNAKLITP